MKRPKWLESSDIRPYVFAREANRPASPGTAYSFKWFEGVNPLIMEPLEMGEVYFANQIMELDQVAFDANGLLTPRWVFYDCAVMPGIIAGFAGRTESLHPEVRKALKVNDQLEWTPLSLFIAIPTPEPGRWMAHNLGSMNSFVGKQHQLRGLGFLSKAWGLWFGNIRELYGVAQWNSPALKLHANYGPLEVVTAYSPIHDYAGSITYRMWVDTGYWEHFLDKTGSAHEFHQKFKDSGRTINPSDESSMIEVQSWIESKQGPFYIDPSEILAKSPGTPLILWTL